MTDFGVLMGGHGAGGRDAVTGPDDEAKRRGQLSRDKLDYIADLIGELQTLAKAGGLDTLGSLLSLAQTEARRELSRR
jgi:hypothetical protein